MKNINDIKKKIQKARKLNNQLYTAIEEIFNDLSNLNIDIYKETKAENANDLEEAILCYINYGEYNVNSIIEEIKEQLNKEDIKMKVCKICDQKLSSKEFNKDIYGEYLDVCKECEAERKMDDDENQDWMDIDEYYKTR